MRLRASTGILIAVFLGSCAATYAIQVGAVNARPAVGLIVSITLVASGAGLLCRGVKSTRDTIKSTRDIIKSTRDTIRGRGRASRGLFPPGRCHACGYDTSSLVRGIVACPECGAILASIPDNSPAPRGTAHQATRRP